MLMIGILILFIGKEKEPSEDKNEEEPRWKDSEMLLQISEMVDKIKKNKAKVGELENPSVGIRQQEEQKN